MECVRSYLERRNQRNIKMTINPLNAELNPICHLLALLGAHHIFHVSGLRVKAIYFRTNFPHSLDSVMGRLMTSVEEGRVVCRGLVGKPEGKYKLDALGVGGRIILKCIFEK